MGSGKTHSRLPTMAYMAAFIYSLLGKKKKKEKKTFIALTNKQKKA